MFLRGEVNYTQHIHAEIRVPYILVMVKVSYCSYQGNVEYKLLSSVFYDLGKGLAERNNLSPDIRDDATNDYFTNGVEEFLQTFPNLLAFVKNSKFKTTIGDAKQISCLAFLRKNARSGFVSCSKHLALRRFSFQNNMI